MRPFLLISHIRIHNANAMSSPYSIGFPAMTAWLGAVHALQRKLQQLPDFETLCLSKVGVSCHHTKNDIAAMHSQKVGNALRSIDTWYPEFDSAQMAIAIEPYGAVTNLGKAYRTPKDKVDFYTLFDQFAVGKTLDTVEQEHYVMAVLVRGGVFGQSGKD